MDFLPEIIIAIISTTSGYFFGSRKSNAETDRIVIDNVKEILEVYSNTINDLKNEISELKQKISGYEKHIEKLQIELKAFRNEMTPKKNVKNN